MNLSVYLERSSIMEYFQKYEIRKISSSKKEYELILYMNDQLTEFAEEFGNETKVKENIIISARQMVIERYPNIHISVVKVLIGGMVVASIPLTANTSSAEAAGTITTSQVTQSDSVYYQVQPGDTLWNLAMKYNSSIENIKKANQLTSDVLQLNQQLIIPKAFHTVGTGDYLSVLAKQYGTTIEAIKQANQLKNDTTILGQTLIIPMNIHRSETPTSSPQETKSNSYTVVAGDSLWAIANRFGTTVDKIKSLNNLINDILRVGQVLTIPTSEEAIPKNYIVV